MELIKSFKNQLRYPILYSYWNEI